MVPREGEKVVIQHSPFSILHSAPMFPALQQPAYRRFWIAQFVSNTGTWMQTIAQGWLVLNLTDSAFLLGFVGFANSVPILLLMLPGGVIADRVDRRKLLRITQSTQAACALLLALSIYFDRITVWQIVVIATILGTSTAFSSPAYQAYVLDLLRRRELLANAIAMNSVQFNLSRIIGPVVAGIVLARFGTLYCFLLNSFSFLPLIAVLSIQHEAPVIPPPRRESMLRGLLDGFAFVASRKLIVLLLLTVAAVSLTGYPFLTLMPLFARRLFGPAAFHIAWLMASVGVGALLGSFYLAARSETRERPFSLIVLTIAGFGTALLLSVSSGATLVVYASMLMAGFAMVTCVATVNTTLQHSIPDEMRGRVLSMYTFAFFGVAPFGNLFAGITAEKYGVRVTFAAMGLLLLLCAVVTAAFLQRWRGETLARLEALESTDELQIV